MSEIMKLSDVASELGVHPNTIRNWCEAGKFPARIDGVYHWLFRRTDIEQWIAEQNAWLSSLKRELWVSLQRIENDVTESADARDWAHDTRVLLERGVITVEELAGVEVQA